MLLLLGGAPGVGKSTVAHQLAHEMGILRLVDLDLIRDLMRLQSREKDDPILFCNALNAWELHGPFCEATVKAGFEAHIRPLLGATFQLIDSYLRTGKSAIFHGVGLLPGHMARYRQRGVLQVLLAVEDETQYRHRFIEHHRLRTGLPPAKVRIDAGWILHQQLVSEARESGIPIVAEPTPARMVSTVLRRISS